MDQQLKNKIAQLFGMVDKLNDSANSFHHVNMDRAREMTNEITELLMSIRTDLGIPNARSITSHQVISGVVDGPVIGIQINDL